MKKLIRKWLGIDHLVEEKVVVTKKEVVKIVQEQLHNEIASQFYNSISITTSEFLYGNKFIEKIIKQINKLQLNK